MQIHSRIAPRQIADQSGQQIRCNGRNDPQSERACQAVLPRTGKIAQVIYSAEDTAHFGTDFGPKRREAHLAGTAFKQGAAQLDFHLFDLHGQRGLRNGAKGGGAAKMLLLRQGFKIAELFQGEVYHNFKLSNPSEIPIFI